MKHHLFQQRGFGVAEIVVVAALLMVIVFGAGQIVALGNRLLEEGENRTQAAFFAREAIEALKSLRNQGWTSNIASLTPGTTYYLATTGTLARQWQLTITDPGPISGPPENFSRTLVLDRVYRDDSTKNIVASGGSEDTLTKRVTVTVSWTERGASRVLTSVTYLADIRAN